MPDKILMRRGNKANLPTLSDGEFGLCEDTKELFMGTTSGNIKVLTPYPNAQLWIAPTLLNSWVNFGSPYDDVGFYKDDLGVVQIRGGIKGGNTATGTVIFSLPEGYRPLGKKEFLVAIYSSGTVATTGAISISPNGFVSVGGAALPSNYFVSLDSLCSFRAEQ